MTDGLTCCLQECTGEPCFADALITLMGTLPQAEWVLTTLGKQGSVLLQRDHNHVEEDKVLPTLSPQPYTH